MSATRTGALIWDLGGVLVRTVDWSLRSQWEARLGLEPRGLHDLVFNGEMSWKASRGEATSEDVWRSVADQLDLSAEDRVRLEKDFWSGDELDADLMQTIRGWKEEHRTGMITNAWPDIRPRIEEEWRIADAFDEIVISAEVGMVKPEPEIYGLMLGRLGVPPEAAVFVDDFEPNIKAARALGMNAVHFTSPESALQEVSSFLQTLS